MGIKDFVVTCLDVKSEEKHNITESLPPLSFFCGVKDGAVAGTDIDNGSCVFDCGRSGDVGTSNELNESVNDDGDHCDTFFLLDDTKKDITPPLTFLAFHQQRYDIFLKAYFGYDARQRAKCVRQAAQMCVIGIGFQKKNLARKIDMVYATRRFLRHSVLAVEGDAAFVRLVKRARLRWCDVADGNVDDGLLANPQNWPNARCIALHYGIPSVVTDISRLCSEKKGEALNFSPATLIAVVASTIIDEGEGVRLCLHSYHRCLDEASWYEQLFGTRHNDWEGCAISVTRGLRRFPMWPDSLEFYHGVGLRHAGTEPVAGFPFTLLDLAEAPSIGKGEKGLFAAHPVPYGTCFLYSGPAVATKVVEASQDCVARKQNVPAFGATSIVQVKAKSQPTPSHSDNSHVVGEGSNGGNTNDVCGLSDENLIYDATYALGLGQHGLCFGQGLMRYANHRYNTSKFGNVELCSVMLSVPSEFSSLAAELEKRRNGTVRKAKKKRAAHRRQKASRCGPSNIREGGGGNCFGATGVKKRRYRPLSKRCVFLEEHSHFVTIPFFITTTDIDVGQQLLAWTYGEEYDARLERRAVCDGNLVPYAYAALLDARTPLGRWQQYKGDYRHGINIGDIVWCPQCASGSFENPVDQLFVVLEMLPKGMNYLLLRPITRVSNTLLEKNLVFHHELSDEMLLLSVCESKVFDWCIIAHVDTVALLLGDVDYWSLQGDGRTSTSSRSARENCCCGGGPSCLVHFIVVNTATLRVATRLVAESKRGALTVERAINGRVWPLLKLRGSVKCHGNGTKKKVVKS